MILDLPDGTAVATNSGSRLILARSVVLDALRQALAPDERYPLVALSLLRRAVTRLVLVERQCATEAAEAGGSVSYDLGGVLLTISAGAPIPMESLPETTRRRITLALEGAP